MAPRKPYLRGGDALGALGVSLALRLGDNRASVVARLADNALSLLLRNKSAQTPQTAQKIQPKTASRCDPKNSAKFNPQIAGIRLLQDYNY